MPPWWPHQDWRRRNWMLALLVISACLGPVPTAASPGWYLLAPPLVLERTESLPPLSQWEQEGAYGSVEACEAARQAEASRVREGSKKMIEDVEDQERRLRSSPPKVSPAVRELLYRLWYGTPTEEDRAWFLRVLRREPGTRAEDFDSLMAVLGEVLFQKEGPRFADAFRRRAEAAICVASDDPRLGLPALRK